MRLFGVAAMLGVMVGLCTAASGIPAGTISLASEVGSCSAFEGMIQHGAACIRLPKTCIASLATNRLRRSCVINHIAVCVNRPLLSTNQPSICTHVLLTSLPRHPSSFFLFFGGGWGVPTKQDSLVWCDTAAFAHSSINLPDGAVQYIQVSCQQQGVAVFSYSTTRDISSTCSEEKNK